MDFNICLHLYRQFPTTNGLFTKSSTTCSFLKSLLTIWKHMSCSDDMSYVITFDIWEVRIMSCTLFDDHEINQSKQMEEGQGNDESGRDLFGKEDFWNPPW